MIKFTKIITVSDNPVENSSNHRTLAIIIANDLKTTALAKDLFGILNSSIAK